MSQLKNTLLGLMLRLTPSVLPPVGADGEVRRNVADGEFYRWDSDELDWVLFGGSPVIGLPTDGEYGDQFNLADLQAGDTTEDAFDKVNTFLEKLAPELPPNLSDINLVLTGAYTALEASTGTSRSTVTSSSTPTVSSSEAFFDGSKGVLSAEINSSPAGSITLTDGDDSGTDDQLTITNNDDYHDGVFGKEGFWRGIMASLLPGSALSLGANTFEMTHSLTGSKSLSVYRDDPGTPSISGQSITGSGTGRLVSGVPSLATGDTITAAFDADDVVSEFYNVTRIGRAESSVTNNLNAALPGSPPAKGATVPISIGLTVAAGSYSENASVTVRAYASNGTQASTTVTNNIRVDTVSNESARLISGEGQYPSSGYGGAFNSATLLTASGNEELQMLNGRYQYPSLTNYSSNTPTAGPNYSGLTAGSWNNMRWATFSLGSVSSATSVTFNLTSTQNFGSTAIVSNFALYVKVEGVTGWLDANAAYPGVGSPSSNGDAALDIGNSTATSKRVTFGSTARTGTVYVRVGIPSGNNKAFSGVS